MILYLAADLLWASKIKGTADALGLPCRPVRTLEMLEARLAELPPPGGVRALAVDLDKPEEALAMIGRLKGDGASGAERAVRVLAFGPHVLKELFERARQAGADEVMARGAFDHGMRDILTRLAAGA